MSPDKILVVTGDDFGISSAVNRAIVAAHEKGVLTSASLMVNGPAFEEAVALTKTCPHLSVGIHISLVRAQATLACDRAPLLVDCAGNLPANPIAAGLRYFFVGGLKAQLEKEAEAQILKFLATGLIPTHMDGDLHFQVHPTVLTILVGLCKKYAIPVFRLPHEPLGINLSLNRTHARMKIFHTIIYRSLCRYARKRLIKSRLRFPHYFFGLLASGFMDEAYLLGLIDRIRPGITEIGLHPALHTPDELVKWAPHYQYRAEFEALLSRKVCQKIKSRKIVLCSHREAFWNR